MNQVFSKIWIIIIALAIVAGGILAWQHWWVPKEEVKVSEEKALEEIVEEEIDKCKDISDLGKQSKCYTDLAKETKDETWCEKINIPEAPEVKANCYVELAILKNDPSICWKVETASLASSCWEYFGMKGWKIYRNEEYGYETKYPQDWKLNILQYGRIVTFSPSSLQKEFTIVVLNDKKYQTLEDEAILPKKPTVCLAGTCVEPTFLKEKEVKLNNFDGIQRQIAYSGLGGLVEIETYILKDEVIFILKLRHWEINEVKSEDLDFYNQILSALRFIEKEETECDKWRKVCAEEAESRCGPCGCRECCAGLTSRNVTYPWKTEKDEVFCIEEMIAYICVKCGDGICGKGEDWCICPEDCPKPNPQDLELFKGEKAVNIEILIKTENFDLNNKTFEGRTRAENTNIKVLTTDSTGFYGGAYNDKGKFIIDNYYTFSEFYSLVKNQSGSNWPFTVKGILEDENVIKAYGVFLIAQ